MDVFSLPEPTPELSAIQQRLDVQQAALGGVIGHLAFGIQNRLIQNQDTLGKIQSKIVKNVKSRITKQAQMLAPITQTLGQTIQDRLTANAVQLTFATPPGYNPNNLVTMPGQQFTGSSGIPVPLLPPPVSTGPTTPTSGVPTGTGTSTPTVSGPTNPPSGPPVSPPVGTVAPSNTWWALWQPETATEPCKCTTVNSADFPCVGLNQGSMCYGPYATQALAQQQCNQLFLEPPTNCGVQTIPGYYCSTNNAAIVGAYQTWTCNGTSNVVVQMTPAQYAVWLTITGVSMMGPYQDLATAQAVCCGTVFNPTTPTGSPPTGPPTPPPVPPPVPPTGPPTPQPPTTPNVNPFTCTIDIASMGVVGSPAWCAAINTLKPQIVSVGNWFLQWLQTAQLPVSVAWAPDCSGVGGAFQPLCDIFAKIVNSSINEVDSVLNTMIGFAQECLTWLSQAAQCLTSCNVPDLMALHAFHTLLRMLEKFRVGWDGAAWLTLDLQAVMPEIEEIIQYLINYSCPIEIPQISDAIEAYLMGQIPLAQAQCWVAMRGGDWSIWLPIVRTRMRRMTAEEAIQYGRRQGLPAAQTDAYLCTLGWLDPTERAAKQYLYDQLPTISDFLQWTTRNVFDTQYVSDYQLDTGFSEKFWPNFGADITAIGMRPVDAQRHYWAHWVNPAPGQLQEMVYRLRPDKQGVQNPFLVTDYQRILAEKDVGPFFQPRFAEMVYKVPSTGSMLDLYDQGIADDPALTSHYQDVGYSPDDAAYFVQLEAFGKRRRRAAVSHGFTVAALAHGFASGSYTDAEVTAEMTKQGFTPAEIDNMKTRSKTDLNYMIFSRARSRVISSAVTQIRTAIDVGVMDVTMATTALVNLGWSQTLATSLVNVELQSRSIKGVQAAIRRLKRAVLAGEIDSTYATSAMQQLGVNAAAISNYIAMWSVENTPNRSRRTAAKIVADVADGQLSQEEAYIRLVNLGYNDADSRLYLAEAAQKIQGMITKEAAAADKVGKQQAKALAALVREGQLATARALEALKRAEPVSKLQKWSKLGLIGFDYFSSRMAMYGYTPGEIQAYYDEACASAKAACVPTTPG